MSIATQVRSFNLIESLSLTRIFFSSFWCPWDASFVAFVTQELLLQSSEKFILIFSIFCPFVLLPVVVGLYEKMKNGFLFFCLHINEHQMHFEWIFVWPFTLQGLEWDLKISAFFGWKWTPFEFMYWLPSTHAFASDSLQLIIKIEFLYLCVTFSPSEFELH